jgi:nucleoside-diphosphate-sugar epimerase
MVLMSGATGRFIVIDEPIPMLADIAREMNRLDPSVQKPLFTLPAFAMPVLPYLEALVAVLGKTPRILTPEMAATMRGRRYNITAARIRRELGWSPAITLAHSLEDTMAAIRASKAGRPAG